MTIELPSRLSLARKAVSEAGQWLISVRGKAVHAYQADRGQLKTEFDSIAEDMILHRLREEYGKEHFLCEESFERKGKSWVAPSSYWTVDALDGTRSFVEGYDGFCVQVAFVQNGRVLMGVVYEPVRRMTFWALKGEGAFVESPKASRRLKMNACTRWPKRPIFIDSTAPKGIMGKIMRYHGGEFLECGSIGLKICRVAEGCAHIYAKPIRFKLWDSAPGDLIVHEAGGRMGLWDGRPIAYDSPQVYFQNILAAASGLFKTLISEMNAFP